MRPVDGTAAPPPADPPPIDIGDLRVGVRHASLEHAPYQLLVGHYHGLPLSGAEAQLNRRSEGRLERLLLTQQYPQQLGDIAILDPVDDAPPRGAIIVGLGPTGELAPLQLRGVVSRALLRVALNELDRRLAGAGPTHPAGDPLGVSSVVVGSSARAGLSIEASVRAIIDGTVAANARLTRLNVLAGRGDTRPATDIVSFRTLEFIERYEDRVDLIVSVLARMEQAGGRSGQGVRQHVTYVTRPAHGEGRSTATSPIDAANEHWRRVDIAAPPDRATPSAIELQFTSFGTLARAPVLRVTAERAVLDPLLATTVVRQADPDVSGTLYELLVPQELKGELGAGEHLHLLVDEHTADYPWELMRPRPDGDEPDVPLALRVGMLRQFRESERIRFDVRRASGHQALVIGNPPSDPGITLPGAMDEALTVTSLLRERSAWNVTSLIWDTSGQSVEPAPSTAAGEGGQGVASQLAATPLVPLHALHQLLNGDWRIVHVAAHGTLGREAASTGVVLGDIHLTANVFSKLSVVPDLVVLNACHLGRVLTGANAVAASVGRSLLGLGVRAVVVAGWAVDDGAARAFAHQLYDELLDGADFGRAVQEARRAAWAASDGSLTWGAYQCYGDPGFTLASTLRPRRFDEVRTTGELRRRLQRLRVRAGDRGRSALMDRVSTRQDIEDELARLVTAAQRIDAPPVVLADVADVWAALLALPRAVHYYRRAVVGGGDVPIRALEQLGNMASRHAQQLHRRDAPAGSVQHRRDVYVRTAESALDAALALGPTGERLALRGGHHKRMATMTAGAARAHHLVAAIRCYRDAQRLGEDPYYEQNWNQLTHVAALVGIPVDPADAWAPSAGVDAASAGAEAPASGEPHVAPDFWARAGAGDALVTARLLAATSADPRPAPPGGWVEAIVAAYRTAFELRSSDGERGSVVGHLRDLRDLLADGERAAPGVVVDDLHRAHAELAAVAARDEPA
jgi:hypothetical protein